MSSEYDDVHPHDDDLGVVFWRVVLYKAIQLNDGHSALLFSREVFLPFPPYAGLVLEGENLHDQVVAVAWNIRSEAFRASVLPVLCASGNPESAVSILIDHGWEPYSPEGTIEADVPETIAPEEGLEFDLEGDS